ncbi:unnamed protein product [Cyprideis torosa]|uniref:Uncharacterized protein n=1 Tax=Cyprideis torosa TaxID=163714 RepID=A0A7R8WKN6_9CRUS|nr:unnamed protein product [Cyprideis torosa]CAG0903409.1 unnamed protein product [Cyprideis torosa]
MTSSLQQRSLMVLLLVALVAQNDAEASSKVIPFYRRNEETITIMFPSSPHHSRCSQPAKASTRSHSPGAGLSSLNGPLNQHQRPTTSVHRIQQHVLQSPSLVLQANRGFRGKPSATTAPSIPGTRGRSPVALQTQRPPIPRGVSRTTQRPSFTIRWPSYNHIRRGPSNYIPSPGGRKPQFPGDHGIIFPGPYIPGLATVYWSYNCPTTGFFTGIKVNVNRKFHHRTSMSNLGVVCSTGQSRSLLSSNSASDIRISLEPHSPSYKPECPSNYILKGLSGTQVSGIYNITTGVCQPVEGSKWYINNFSCAEIKVTPVSISTKEEGPSILDIVCPPEQVAVGLYLGAKMPIEGIRCCDLGIK